MCTCLGVIHYSQQLTHCGKLAADPQESFAWNEIVMTNKEKTPAPRYCHTGWKFAEKLWTFGGHGSSPAGFLHKYGDFDLSCNNQLLYFNPSTDEWTNPQCYPVA